MRKLICRVSGILCIACVGMVFVAFFTKLDNVNPWDAGRAIAFWVMWGWVFAIVNYASLPKGKPPPVNPVAYWRWLRLAVQEVTNLFPDHSQQFGLSFWVLIILIFMIFASLVAPAVQSAERTQIRQGRAIWSPICEVCGWVAGAGAAAAKPRFLRAMTGASFAKPQSSPGQPLPLLPLKSVSLCEICGSPAVPDSSCR